MIAQLITLEPTVVSRGVEGGGAGIIAVLYKIKRASTGSAPFPWQQSHTNYRNTRKGETMELTLSNDQLKNEWLEMT